MYEGWGVWDMGLIEWGNKVLKHYFRQPVSVSSGGMRSGSDRIVEFSFDTFFRHPI